MESAVNEDKKCVKREKAEQAFIEAVMFLENKMVDHLSKALPHGFRQRHHKECKQAILDVSELVKKVLDEASQTVAGRKQIRLAKKALPGQGIVHSHVRFWCEACQDYH